MFLDLKSMTDNELKQLYRFESRTETDPPWDKKHYLDSLTEIKNVRSLTIEELQLRYKSESGAEVKDIESWSYDRLFCEWMKKQRVLLLHFCFRNQSFLMLSCVRFHVVK